MDKKTLQQMFKKANRDLFDNMLDIPEFYLYTDSEMKNLDIKYITWEFDGLCYPIGDYYLVGIRKSLTRKEIYYTLLHEMMHMVLMNKNGYSGHGKPFLKLCEKTLDKLTGI